MSERERWIVYPLLFFALGAAIRDKIIKEVRTDRIMADQISCLALAIVDPENPGRVLAELSSTSGAVRRGGEPKQFGRLVLTDSDGREYFGLADDLLQMRDVRCESLSVVNPDNPDVALAQLTSTPAPLDAAGRPSGRIGVLALNNQSYAGWPTGSPPSDAADESPSAEPTSKSGGEGEQ